ncbi:MAG: RNA polymerase sigma factor [Acidobacteriota bacterium]
MRSASHAIEERSCPEAPPVATAADGDLDRIERAQNGDRLAFEALVRRHHRPIYNYIYRMVGSGDLAADLTQEVFLKVYTALSTFNPAYRFTTWLYKIASNRVIDHLRRRRTHLIPLDPAAADRAGTILKEVPGHEQDPEWSLRVQESASSLATALRALPGNYRDLIILRHFQHRSYEEIACIKNSPLGTVKNRLFRAREALRRRLSP